MNLRLADDDLTCIAKLERLRSLTVSSQFDRAQIAFLAKRLNHRLVEPLRATIASALPCDVCGTHKQLFTWRKAPFLCPSCDRARFEKIEREFHQLVEAS